MTFRLFQYPFPAPADLPELNEYLRSERVAIVNHYIVQSNAGSLLVFLVETARADSADAKADPAGKTDFKEILSVEEYRVFNKLRDLRKKWADEQGVPLYTLFTNAQFAGMVRGRASNPGQLSQIAGIGPARIEKYGAELIKVLAEIDVPRETVP